MREQEGLLNHAARITPAPSMMLHCRDGAAQHRWRPGRPQSAPQARSSSEKMARALSIEGWSPDQEAELAALLAHIAQRLLTDNAGDRTPAVAR